MRYTTEELEKMPKEKLVETFLSKLVFLENKRR